MNLERFKDISPGIQSIAVCAAVVFGGAWTLYSFLPLQPGERARAAIAEMEAKKHRQSNIQISLEPSHRTDPTSKDILLFVTVSVRNAGNRNIHLDYPNGTPLRVNRVDINNDGTNRFHESVYPVLYSEPGAILTGTVIRADSVDKHPFVVRLQQKGTYLLQFQAAIDDYEQGVASKAGSKGKKGKYRGGASCYYAVE